MENLNEQVVKTETIDKTIEEQFAEFSNLENKIINCFENESNNTPKNAIKELVRDFMKVKFEQKLMIKFLEKNPKLSEELECKIDTLCNLILKGN